MADDAPDTGFAHSSRVARLERLVARARLALPGEIHPCYAHMRLRTDRGERDVLLGPRTVLERDANVLDARTAPLARVLYAYDEGEAYEVDHEGRTLEGTLVEKTLLTLDGDRIVGIAVSGRDYRRVEAEVWAADPEWRVIPRPEGERGHVHSPIDVPLDPVQRAAVTAPSGLASLVVGEAGSGKTTVALHRLAHLARAAHERGEVHRSLYLAPTEGLARLVSVLVDRLGASDVEVARVDRFAAELARRSLRRLPTKTNRDASAAVIRVKRHRALGAAIDALLAGERAEPDAPLATRDDLLELFGDRDRLRLAREASSGGIRESDVEAVALHTRAQFEARTEDVFADVTDASKLAALDGRSLDAGTPADAAGRIDAEDFAVLLEIARRRADARGVPFELPRRYHAIVVDEAQELSPLELRMVGRALLPGGTLIVAGDEAQQLDDTAGFQGFEQTLFDLGAESYATVRLATSYRCPENVNRLARTLRADVATGRLDPAGVAPEVTLAACANECHVAARIGEVVRTVRDVDVAASVAVICRDAPAARRFHGVLGPSLDVPLALDGDFDFRARVHVTAVAEVKGLEFDYVVLPDATALAYRREPEAARALYVAVTRASQQLVVLGAGELSELLP